MHLHKLHVQGAQGNVIQYEALLAECKTVSIKAWSHFLSYNHQKPGLSQTPLHTGSTCGIHMVVTFQIDYITDIRGTYCKSFRKSCTEVIENNCDNVLVGDVHVARFEVHFPCSH